MSVFDELFEDKAVSRASDDVSVENLAIVSCAISLKRIADVVCNNSINQYGENLAEALQNGIARGLRGINTHDR